jgi:hypothetical protein
MSTTINALTSSSINFAEFVKLTLPAGELTFCNAAAPITVGDIEFEGLSTLLQIGEIQKNIKSNSADLQLSLTGIDPDTVAVVLSAAMKGSKVEIWRGFLDANNQIITTPTLQFFKRYQGIINNVAINEDFNTELRQRVATCVLTSASMRSVLDARVAGIKTNEQSWKVFYPNDTSMDRVAVIASTYFDFGKKPIGGGQMEATPTADAEQTTSETIDQSAGGG